MVASKVSFSFRQRRERVDWKILASVDVDKVAREVDVVTLQDNTSNVTFCDIQAEMEPSALPPNFVKLYRLAQLIIEYLIYSQECLTQTISSLESEVNDLKKPLKNKRAVSNKRAKSKEIPNVIDENAQNKCAHCPKVFLNETYLQFHVQRRHTEFNSNGKNGKLESDIIEKELEELKNRLKVTERTLEEEREAKRNVHQLEKSEFERKELMMRKEMERWKVDEMENRKKELDQVRDICLMEIKKLNDRYLMSENVIENMRKTNEVIAESNEKNVSKMNHQFWQKQQREMEIVTEELKLQVAQVEKVIGVQLKEQQNQWMTYVQSLEKKFNKEPIVITETKPEKLSAGTSEPNLPMKSVSEEKKLEISCKKQKGFMSLREALRKRVERIATKKLKDLDSPSPTGRQSLFRKLVKNRSSTPVQVEQSRLAKDSNTSLHEIPSVGEDNSESDDSYKEENEGLKVAHADILTREVLVETPTPLPRPRTTVSNRAVSVPDLAASIESVFATDVRVKKPIGGVDVLGRIIPQSSVIEYSLGDKNLKRSAVIPESTCSTPTSIWDSSVSD